MGRIRVLVKPRARTNEVLGMDEAGFLLVNVRAIPDKGAANKAVKDLLADFFSVPKSTVAVIRGGTSRHKTVEVSGLSDEELQEKALS